LPCLINPLGPNSTVRTTMLVVPLAPSLPLVARRWILASPALRICRMSFGGKISSRRWERRRHIPGAEVPSSQAFVHLAATSIMTQGAVAHSHPKLYRSNPSSEQNPTPVRRHSRSPVGR
jgi:hypothetical protein